MLHGHRILIIEDEPLIALDLKYALSEARADVVGIATTPDQALQLADTPSLAAAIVDLRLNGQSVRRTVARLAERNVPFIFYSGYDDAPTARSWPAAPFLVKPQEPQSVIDVLARMIADQTNAIRGVKG